MKIIPWSNECDLGKLNDNILEHLFNDSVSRLLETHMDIQDQPDTIQPPNYLSIVSYRSEGRSFWNAL